MVLDVAYNENGSGSGSALSPALLWVAGFATVVATLVSAMSILMHLRNYRKPMLQRMVIRIMLMVPIYAISSLISLFSLEAAFVIDVIRDIYEAFVIYCFFQLLLGYLGGERSLLILVHGRQPKIPPIPMNVFQRELDVSDPYTFLFLKRGILQYVQVKPLLAVASLILKAAGKFNEGEFRVDSGYLYVSIVYNASICLSLYCLAMFWLSINEDLAPFRPMPKFLCVKGILFFSFWQATGISVLVSVGLITRLGPYADKEHISLGLTDTLICLEMPLFAIAHLAAFSHRDYIDRKMAYVGRMPMRYAFRDAFSLKDVFEDARATLHGRGMDYREFEPSEGHMHQGLGRERRIRAGLRYSRGGQGKYWLPQPATSGRLGRLDEDVHAPLLADEVDDIVHDVDDDADEEHTAVGFELPFGGPDPEDERLFASSRQYLFGDYNYPCIDASSEIARAEMWDEEERILSNERSAWFSDYKGRRTSAAAVGYGAVGVSRPRGDGPSTPSTPLSPGAVIDMEADRQPAGDPSDVRLRWTKVSRPDSGLKLTPPPAVSRISSASTSAGSSPAGRMARSDAVDLVVGDDRATEAAAAHERHHGEPAMRGAGRQVYRRQVGTPDREEVVEAHVRAESSADIRRAAQEAAQAEEESGAEAAAEIGVVARAETPPPHAQMGGLMSPYDRLDDHENPWA
ncbi:organic solute transporter Ostalpha-domain-containing protein [Gloeopeniophorella convolvens]|nr:organic solute transporter Ostalpha-domain-containing protein [Gloeopeniophorella convolvens]